MPGLPAAFLGPPLAHRALHDRAAGRPENARAAVRAAVAAGYGIEIDLQPSADGRAMVFHDYALDRLTARTGPIHAHDAAALARIPLTGGEEGIPTLAEVLEIVAGRVPLLIEIKGQDRPGAPGIGPLEAAAAADLAGYRGPVAVMSFAPRSVAEMARLAPGLPRGLTTDSYDPADYPRIDEQTRARLRAIPDYDAVGASFISHNWKDLSRPRVAELKAAGAAVLCWTIRSAEDEATARRVAQNVTFEGYAAALP
jgi:glycerophosphoryl diester phosphodiesterase